MCFQHPKAMHDLKYEVDVVNVAIEGHMKLLQQSYECGGIPSQTKM